MSRFTDEQLRAFRERLEPLREELAGRLRSSRESARPVDLEEPIGRLARADAMQVQQMVQAQRRQTEVQLQLVNAALGRIRAGTYGECVACEEEIGLERLEIAPESPQCLSCRRMSEQR